MNEERISDIVRTGRSLFLRGYAHGTAGNISVLHDDGITITPTDISLGELDRVELAECDRLGQQLRGARASKTIELHRRIYEHVPNAKCIIHTHAAHTVALTLAGVWTDEDVLPPITPYYVMKVGHTPLIPYQRPGDPVVADLVIEQIRRRPNLRAVMLDRLGPLVWGATLAEAMATLEELDETARVWLAADRPTDAALPAAALEAIGNTFGQWW